jgi:hypothetical protein
MLRRMRQRFGSALLVVLCLSVASRVYAQEPAANGGPAAADGDARGSRGSEEPKITPSPEPDPYSVGDYDVRLGERYTSPLKKFGIDLGLAPYALSALTGLMYLVFVYPVQSIFGSSSVEPVMPWLLLPIIGPWMAQYTRHVKDKPVWRAILIGDAALQATGLVLGIIGELLSGWRDPPKDSKTSLDLHLQLGVAGGSVAGLTLTLRTL